jgi:hypothetical protein
LTHQGNAQMRCPDVFLWKPEIDKQPPEVLAIVFYPVIQGLNVWQLKKAFYLFAQLPAALSGYNFHFPYFIINGLLKSILQGFVNGFAVVVNIVQVELYSTHN